MRPTVPAGVRSGRPLLPIAGVAGAVVGLTLGLLLTGTVEFGLSVTRAVFYLAGVVTVGASLFPLLLGGRHPAEVAEELATARRIAVGAGAVWTLAALASLTMETAALYTRRTITFDTVATYVRLVPTGTALAVAAALAAVCVLGSTLALRAGSAIPAWVLLVLAFAPLLPLPLSGHMRALPAEVRVPAMVLLELHVLAVTAWAGGLLLVVGRLGTRRAMIAEVLPRFSKLAGVCVFVTALTGSVLGLAQLTLSAQQPWYQALSTGGYGYILLGKTAAVLVLGALGAHVRFRLLPAIRSRARTGLLRWVGWELTVMGTAFGLAVVLTRTSLAAG